MCLEKYLCLHSDKIHAREEMINDEQRSVLKQSFADETYPSEDTIQKLSKQLGLKKILLYIWFRNERNKLRKRESRLLPKCKCRCVCFCILRMLLQEIKETIDSIKRYSSTSQVGIGRVLNGVLYLRYGRCSKKRTNKRCKTHIDENLQLFLCLMQPESNDFSSQSRRSNAKISICSSFSFCFFLLLSSSISSSITQKVYDVCKRSAHQMNAQLSEIILSYLEPHES